MAIEVVNIPEYGVNGPRREIKRQLGKDDFLFLLTKQLQNQDPMKPMDNIEFVSQMAQFTSLEQMTNMNKSFEKFLSVFSEGYKTQAVGFLGKTIVAKPNGSPEEISGVVTGVRFEKGEAIFSVDNYDVKLNEIIRVNLGV